MGHRVLEVLGQIFELCLQVIASRATHQTHVREFANASFCLIFLLFVDGKKLWEVCVIGAFLKFKGHDGLEGIFKLKKLLKHHFLVIHVLQDVLLQPFLLGIIVILNWVSYFALTSSTLQVERMIAIRSKVGHRSWRASSSLPQSAAFLGRRKVYISIDWAMYMSSQHSFKKRSKKCCLSIKVNASLLPVTFLAGNGGIKSPGKWQIRACLNS